MSVWASIPTYRRIVVLSFQESRSKKMTFAVQDEGNTTLPNVGDHLSKGTHWNVHTHKHTHTHTNTQPQAPHMTTESILLAVRTLLQYRSAGTTDRHYAIL